MPQGQVNVVEINPVKAAGVTNFETLEQVAMAEDVKIWAGWVCIGVGDAAYGIEIFA